MLSAAKHQIIHTFQSLYSSLTCCAVCFTTHRDGPVDSKASLNQSDLKSWVWAWVWMPTLLHNTLHAGLNLCLDVDWCSSQATPMHSFIHPSILLQHMIHVGLGVWKKVCMVLHQKGTTLFRTIEPLALHYRHLVLQAFPL